MPAKLTHFLRVAEMLRLLAEQPAGCTLADLLTLGRDLDFTEGSLRRDLDELESCGWVERQAGRWFIGPRLGGFAVAYTRRLHERVLAADRDFRAFLSATLCERSDT